MNRLTRVCLVFITLFAVPMASSAQQAPEPRTYELTARDITLPPSNPGFVSVLAGNCSECRTLSVSSQATTQYRIDSQEVPLATLRSQFATYPNAMVLLVLDNDLKHVKLIEMYLPQGAVR